eukprot:1458345-Rhodomonas_salina.1
MAVPHDAQRLHPGQSQPPRNVHVRPARASRAVVVVEMLGLADDRGEKARSIVDSLAFAIFLFRMEVDVEHQARRAAYQHRKEHAPHHARETQHTLDVEREHDGRRGVEKLDHLHFRCEELGIDELP